MTSKSLSLRPYQRESVDAVHKAHSSGMKSPAVVMATGLGKTVCFSNLAAEHIERKNSRVIVLAHRDELVDQAIEKIRITFPGLHVGKIKAEDNGVHATVMVASVQTLSRKNRLDDVLSVAASGTYMSEIGLIITDEVHLAAAQSYKTIYEALPGALRAGYTATLARGDGVGLGSVVDDVVYSRSVLWGISRGYLCDIIGQSVSLENLDLSKVRKSGGDYQAGALGSAMVDAGSPAAVSAALRKYAPDRRSIVFCPDVFSAQATATAIGPSAAVIHGKTPREERRLAYKKFETGEIRQLVNCMVLTTGFDAPWADCIVIARPTQSAPLFVQMAGRGTRTWPGKENCLLLDVTGTGGRLSTLIDLAPGEVDAVRRGESLAEAAIRYETEQDTIYEADSLAFALKHRDLDMFAGSAHAWLRTDGGVMFIACANAYVFLWASGDGTWDVGYAPAHGKWSKLHTGLPLGTAMAWGETEAEDRMPFNGTKKARWRKERAGNPQIARARRYGFVIPDMPTKGQISDLISIGEASLRFDPVMQRMSK